MKYCTDCGNKFLIEAKFCSSCGKACEKIEEIEISFTENTDTVTKEKILDIKAAVAQKTHDIVNKIKSSKWNAFFVKGYDLEEYIADGVSVPDAGLFSSFSKATRENNARRGIRFIDLLKQRVCNVDAEYIKHNQEKPEKAIILAVTGKNKGLFVSASALWTKSVDENDKNFIELIEKEKEECGDIVAFYPILFLTGEAGMFFITTKGVCFIKINKDDMPAGAGTFAAVSAASPYGAIATAIAGVTTHFISGQIEKYNLGKPQQLITEYSYKYSPCLVARCFKEGQFVPFNMINILAYGFLDGGNGAIGFTYQNKHEHVHFQVTNNAMSDLIEKLSGENPPEINN